MTACKLHILVVIAIIIISCFVKVSLSSNNFEDDNLIRLVVSNNGLRDSKSSVFSIVDDGNVDDDDDKLSFAGLTRPPIEAIYQFGDSINDAGNYVIDNPYASYNKDPYGETYFHKPTGRCSDGMVIVDYIAKYLNIPLVDAYLNKDGKFTHGVNFAVASATALDLSTLLTKYNVTPPTNRSLDVQLGWLKSHLDSNYWDESERRNKLANGLILMGEIGGNDYNSIIWQPEGVPGLYKMVPDVIQAIKNAVQAVIDMGATRIVVPGNFPVGCMTVYLDAFKWGSSSMFDELGCVKHLNEFAAYHNNQLRLAMGSLLGNNPDVAIMYGNYYDAMRHVLQHATEFGFNKTVMFKACCGKGDDIDYNLDFSNFCGTGKDHVCEHPHKRVSWDGIHLTQHAYEIMSKWLIKDIFGGRSEIGQKLISYK